MITTIRVYNSEQTDSYAQMLHEEIKRTLHIDTISNVQTVKVYRLSNTSQKTAEYFANTVLVDKLTQSYKINESTSYYAAKKIEIAKKPGVMNPEVATLLKAAQDLSLVDLDMIDTSIEYHFFGDINEDQLELICNRLLMNKTIEFNVPENFIPATTCALASVSQRILMCVMNDAQLIEFAEQHQLFLTLSELRKIQEYFIQRGSDPYDIELETIAQTWSEHCYHKTFKSQLIINGVEKKPLFTRLKETAQHYDHNVISAFIDNAGVFRFYDGYAILGKVETHNSPSALEPYGGAATGSGGVFRDIMGTGQGARVIASTDMFCFAPPNLPDDKLPAGCLSPDYLLRKVVAGVRDYGNRMGIPTNNGSVHFHEDFKAKPTVIVGAYGIAPEESCKKGSPCAGDLIVVIGGRTGRDGIHGATFSSAQMTSATMQVNASAVQIGNAIEEKRVLDAIIVARDQQLIRAITDCGAGGFSSAIGEMASEVGAEVYLEKVPLKYDGLLPWEIWISESQERMICAIAPEQIEKFKKICEEYNVQATEVGIFTNSHNLVVYYYEQQVCNLAMDFLHHGIPLQPLHGFCDQPKVQKNIIPLPENWQKLYCDIVADWNICSKEPIVRQYDHTVQGSNALLSFSGIEQQGPQDAAVLTPILGKQYGLIISHGMNPILNRLDPYAGGWWSIIEALSNLVAVGGDIAQTVLIDNFIWPCPNEYYLGYLDAALEACIDAMNLFKIPFISGKDSLSSTYRYKNGDILNIPPVLCISAYGKISDVRNTISSDFKQPNSYILLVGNLDNEALGGSTYLSVTHQQELCNQVPQTDRTKLPLLFAALYQLINAGAVKACHDISEGGVAVALAEMCFGSQLGAQLDLSFLQEQRIDFFLFNETTGCFLLEVEQKDINHPLFAKIPHHLIGHVIEQPTISVQQHNQKLFEISTEILLQAWQQPMKKVFGL